MDNNDKLYVTYWIKSQRNELLVLCTPTKTNLHDRRKTVGESQGSTQEIGPQIHRIRRRGLWRDSEKNFACLWTYKARPDTYIRAGSNCPCATLPRPWTNAISAWSSAMRWSEEVRFLINLYIVRIPLEL